MNIPVKYRPIIVILLTLVFIGLTLKYGQPQPQNVP